MIEGAVGFLLNLVIGGIVIVAICLVLPARRQDPPPQAGRLRDLLGTPPLTVAAVWRSTLTWIRAFYRTQKGIRRIYTVLQAPVRFGIFAVSRIARRTVCVWQGRSDGFAMLMLRVEGDNSWILWDLAAWPLGGGEAKGLMARVLEAADKGGVKIRLVAANQRLASRYYVPLGFAFENGSEQHEKPAMLRLPRAL